jgi:hypothetical protein
MDLGTLVDQTIASYRSELQKKLDEVGDKDREISHKSILDAMGAHVPPEQRLPKMVDISGRTTKKRLEISMRRMDAYKAALRLAINTLC